MSFVDAWPSTGLTGRSIDLDGGSESLYWVVNLTGAERCTLTKHFRVEAFQEETQQGLGQDPVRLKQVGLQEELTVFGALLGRREVRLEEERPELVSVGGYSMSGDAVATVQEPGALPLVTLILVVGGGCGATRLKSRTRRREDAPG